MRQLLLDACSFLWVLKAEPRLGRFARELILDERNQIFVSAATAWEIAIKRAIGKLIAPANIDAIIDEKGFLKLPITPAHADCVGNLPDHHRDPFDRMLIAQAQFESLEIISPDHMIARYPVRVVDAEK